MGPWEIPWTEEPGGLQSMWLPRVRHGSASKEQQQQRARSLVVVSYALRASMGSVPVCYRDPLTDQLKEFLLYPVFKTGLLSEVGFCFVPFFARENPEIVG